MNPETQIPGTGQVHELRDAMMEQMKRLADPMCNMEKEIQRSQAMSAVGNVVIGTIKAELDYVRLSLQANGKNKGIPDKPQNPALPTNPTEA
jgi:hypothetical protein